jgi:hypothetical protein
MSNSIEADIVVKELKKAIGILFGISAKEYRDLFFEIT